MKMKTTILALLLGAIALPFAAFADNYVTVPNPTAVWDTTTGAVYALGTPGNTAKTVLAIPSSANTWTGANNFTGTFQIGGVTESFPTSGLLVGRTDTQTLTNKTLTSPIDNTPTITSPAITGPAPVACGASCTVGTSNDLTLLNQAAGSTATLQGATGSGNVHKFRVTVLTTSGAEKILTNPTTDIIVGTAIGENASTAIVFVGNAGTYHSIQMPFAGSQPSGGFIGDQVTCTDIAAGKWACDINYQGGTTPTTPYSASTS